MLLPFLALIIPLLSSSWLTGQLYRDAIRWQGDQIAVDDLAILTGRTDRQTLNDLERANDALTLLDRAHHIVHACSAVAKSTVACVSSDRAMELKMAEGNKLMREVAMARWRLAENVAGLRLRALGFRRMELRSDRASELILEPVYCPFCRLQRGWRIPSYFRGLEYGIYSRHPPHPSVGVRLYHSNEPKRAWNYELDAFAREQERNHSYRSSFHRYDSICGSSETARGGNSNG